MFNKNKENDIDNGQKDRKLKEEQFIQTKKNWCNTKVSQIKDFLIFLILKIIFRLFLFVSSKWSIKIMILILIIVQSIEN